MWVNAKFLRVITNNFAAAAVMGLCIVTAPTKGIANQIGYQLNEVETAHVSRIKSYLNRISTMQARFIQTNPDGKTWEGTLSIKRPGNFRFEYDPPVPHTLISNGTWFIHVDRELKESNFLPLGRTPARFLLAKQVRFDEEVKLIGFLHKAGLIHLKIVNTEFPDLGYVTLTFNERPLALLQWRMHNALNQDTLITLQNARIGLRLNPELFKFVEPQQEDQDQD
ncbi:MAG: hypothetical protein CMM76_01600 [Rhodospirillaceae bacterium]|nr:hypothetical protein [Rhodospirillaceae bacterium]